MLAPSVVMNAQKKTMMLRPRSSATAANAFTCFVSAEVPTSAGPRGHVLNVRAATEELPP
jgi:hypothetical protein